MNKRKANVQLTENDIDFLNHIIKEETHTQKAKRAKILLLADEGGTNISIAKEVGVHKNTVGTCLAKYKKTRSVVDAVNVNDGRGRNETADSDTTRRLSAKEKSKQLFESIQSSSKMSKASQSSTTTNLDITQQTNASDTSKPTYEELMNACRSLRNDNNALRHEKKELFDALDYNNRFALSRYKDRLKEESKNEMSKLQTQLSLHKGNNEKLQKEKEKLEAKIKELEKEIAALKK